MAYGYRYGEVPLAALGRMKDGIRFLGLKAADLSRRAVVAVTLPWHWAGASLVHCCPSDPWTMLAGVRKRFGMLPPKPNRRELKKFNLFVRRWLRKNLRPLARDLDTSLETWLASTGYTEERKDELRKCWEECVRNGGIFADPRYTAILGFMKDEFYTEFKQARGINARADESKCRFGPIFRLIEKELFARPEFIKKVPVADRPEYIWNRLYRVGARYIATDYSSFEALFTREIMESCEFELYRHMTKKLHGGREWYQDVVRVLGGENRCKYKHFTVVLPATRMSGEMCTSLGNGFSNLMFMLYVCKAKGCREVVGVVEGDDGLFVFVGEAPTPEDFAKLGLIIKAEYHDELATASFCGLVFAPEDRNNVADIRKVLAGFGFTSAKYANAKRSKLIHLMRAKALSLLHQYPGCPVLQEFGEYILRSSLGAGSYQHTKRIHLASVTNVYLREKFMKMYDDLERTGYRLPKREVGVATRLLVERLYGVSVETQLEMEAYFAQKDGLSADDLSRWLVPHRDWEVYWRQYVQPSDPIDPDRPASRWVRAAGTRHPLEPTVIEQGR